jgi:DNA-directed RNA polymerase subunit RPC12/RpoP
MMPLTTRLQNVDLTLECKYCGHPITKKGSWFRTSRHSFKCDACKREVRMTYEDKIVLFAKYAHLES